MTELYVGHEATLPPTYDPDLIPMTVVQAAPLLVREMSGTRNLSATNGVTNWVHAPGDVVLVRRSTATVTQTLASRPQSGTVTVVAGTLITVTAAGVTWSLRSVGTVPTVGQTVAITWGSEGGVCHGAITGTIPAPTGTLIAPLPPSGSTIVLPAFRPVQSASYRSGAKRTDTSDLYQGHWTSGNSNDNTGIWTYGAAWGALLGKTVDVAKIKVKRGPVGTGVNGAETVHLKLHNVSTPPATTPSLNASSNNSLTLSPNELGEVDVTAMVQEIANGTAAGFAVTFVGTSDYAMFLGAGSSDSGVINATVH